MDNNSVTMTQSHAAGTETCCHSDSCSRPDADTQSASGIDQTSKTPVALMVVAHSPLASALRDIAQHVFGAHAPLTAIDVLPGACAADSSGALMNQIKALDQGAGVLVMTDLPGASPCNVCSGAAQMARDAGIPCEVITGVNAAMVLRAISYRESGIQTLVEQVIEGASRTVMRVD